MMSSASALFASCLLLALLEVAMATTSQELSVQGHGRRLNSVSQQYEFIWGQCAEKSHTYEGCTLADPATCSSFLSSGPANSDIEIKLGGLRKPGQEEKMHLQWWAARKSTSDYDPLRKPETIIYSDIYAHPFWAYPRYDADDYNGGNVEVGADGEAVIRLQTPATFMMFPFIAFPSLHLRTCLGDDFASWQREALIFSNEGPIILDACMKSDRNVTILGYRYVGDSDWIVPATSLPAIEQTSSPTRSPTSPPTTSPTTSPTSWTTSLEPATSPTSTAIPPTARPNLVTKSHEVVTKSHEVVDLRIKSAREALDLQALEFSPIYSCFMDGKFFNHFSSDCAAECPSSSAVVHGQCAKKEVSQTSVTLSAAWILDIECSAQCWEQRKTATLHELRVAVADHLDVPFQEVSVTVSLLGPVSRQLDATGPGPHRRLGAQQMRLSVAVDSRRISDTQDHEHLRKNFIVSAEDATYHVGLQVNKVVSDHDHGMTDVVWPADPYTPAYDALEPKAGGAAIGTTPTSGLPPVVIVSVAACIAIIGFAFAVFLRCKRWRNAKKLNDAAEAQAANQVADKVGPVEDVAEDGVVPQPEPIKGSAEV